MVGASAFSSYYYTCSETEKQPTFLSDKQGKQTT